MLARKKTGPRPLPVRLLTEGAQARPLAPVVATGLAASAALVLAASSLLACATASHGTTGVVVDVTPTATDCPRLGGAPPAPTNYATATPSATPSATAAQHIEPNPDPPPLPGEPPMTR